jgi:hypothetical protein
MATIAPPPVRRFNLVEAQRKIRHPLARLRAWIRGYVTLEGLLVLLLYVALWFWIGLILDYGAFRLLEYDWVQDMPWVVRAVVLFLLVGGLLAAVTYKVLMRLFTEFRDAALALVLERRFPKILGDRLITAIELHDTRRAEQQGYSVAMIHQTVQEAAGRVDQLPIKQVFNWKRLSIQAMAVLTLTVVCYLLALVAVGVVNRVRTGQWAAGESAGDFHQVAGIWFQRDVLLQDVIWPRRAFLEIVGWPKDENGKPLAKISIGQNAQPPAIRVRARKYIIAERKAPEGWRAMNWADVSKVLKTDQLPEPPGDWQARTDEPAISVDDADLQLSKFDVRKTVEGKAGSWFIADPQAEGGWRPLVWSDLSKERLGGPDVPQIPVAWAAKHDDPVWKIEEIDALLNAEDNAGKDDYAELRNVVMARLNRYDAFRTTLEALDAKLAERNMGRTARKVTVPRTVTINIRGRSANNTMMLTTLPDNEYSGSFTDLKDSGQLPWTFTFRAHGEDYSTPPKQIVVVAAPNLVSLMRQERRPAYLYYQLAGDVTAKDLRGKKQLMTEEPCSIFGGETTRIDVPAGTDVTLTAVTDKPIASIRALKNRKTEEELKPAKVFERPDDTTFRTTFPDVRQEIAFVLEFTDKDGVVGYRSVVIRPAEEHFPDVDLEPLIVRKTKEGLMISPLARLPFNGKVTDKFGLSKVQFAYNITPVEVGGASGPTVYAALFAGAVPMMNGAGNSHLLGLAYLETAAMSMAKAGDDKKPDQYLGVAGFEQALRDANLIYDGPTLLNLATITQRLNQQQKAPYRSLLREYALKPDKWERAEFDDIKNDFLMSKAQYGGQPLLDTDPVRTQRRYRVQLWLEGVNTDIDSGPEGQPKVSPSKDKFTFIVVSEGELLAEIAKEEEGLYGKLEDVMNRLLETQTRLTQLNTEGLASTSLKPEDFAPMIARVGDMDEILDKNQVVCKEVLTDYQRILQEYRLNQVTAKKVTDMEQGIVKPLTEIDQLSFPRARIAVGENFRSALANKDLGPDQRRLAAQKAGQDAGEKVQQVIETLRKVMEEMQGLISLDKEIEKLRKIAEDERMQVEFLKALRKILEDELFGPAEKPKK